MRSLPAWSPKSALVHIGSLKPLDKGRFGDSGAGHGLCVSDCPADWQEIAELRGQPWWTLKTRTGDVARFLDWDKVCDREIEGIIEWAIKGSLVSPCATYELHWCDADNGRRHIDTFEDCASALGLKALLRREVLHSPVKSVPLPELHVVTAWQLTPDALSRLCRRGASLRESTFLCALLYVEAHPELGLDGVHLDRQPAPAAVIVPSRLSGFIASRDDPTGATTLGWRPLIPRVPYVPEATPCSDTKPKIDLARYLAQKSAVICDQIVDFVKEGSPQQLREAIAKAPGYIGLYKAIPRLPGTVLFHAVEQALILATSTEACYIAKALDFVECARLLVGYPYTNGRDPDHGVATDLLVTDWSTSSLAASAIAELACDLIRVGDFDICSPIPGKYYPGGLRPLAAAIMVGNPFLVTVLLEAGCRLDDAMLDLAEYAARNGLTDLIEISRSFGRRNSAAVATRIANWLMCEHIAAAQVEVAPLHAHANAGAADAHADTSPPATGLPTPAARRRMV